MTLTVRILSISIKVRFEKRKETATSSCTVEEPRKIFFFVFRQFCYDLKKMENVYLWHEECKTVVIRTATAVSTSRIECHVLPLNFFWIRSLFYIQFLTLHQQLFETLFHVSTFGITPDLEEGFAPWWSSPKLFYWQTLVWNLFLVKTSTI